MENLKIKVNSEAESKEAQELFFELGYVWTDTKCQTKMKYTVPVIYSSFEDGDLCCDKYDINHNHKEITPQELRDMVNPMKEYLEKQADGSYKLVMRGIVGKDGDIEVPEGANFYCDRYFWMQLNSKKFWNGDNWQNDFKTLCGFSKSYNKTILWQRHTQPEELPFIDDEPTLDKVKIKINGDLNQAVEIAKDMGYYNCQFEKIPQNAYWLLCNESGSVDYSMNENILNEYAMLHIEDELESLNDQYAEIEQVRKHRHYFKDVSNIAEIDVYAVLKLFDVTDPCLQHIVKKSLCAGKRGHKDMMEDLQNIVDTAIRAVELNS